MAAAAVTRRIPGVLRSFGSLFPLACNSSCSIRSVSGFPVFRINPGQISTVSARKPLLFVSNVSCGHSISVLDSVTPLLPSILHQQKRTVTQFSLRKGKRKTVKAVVERFLRLRCGLWLRRRAGYKKKLWKKSARRKKRLREQVFCNKTQCKLLDKMTTSFWKRRNWYASDPFQKYHDRTNLKL